MRSLLPVALVLLTVLFFGSYFAGYHVPGERTLDSAQGARVVDVPQDRPGRLTDPHETRFRRWVEFYIHVAVNRQRTQRGLAPLEFDAALRDVARGHSVTLRPWESRYQLAHPPTFHTVRSMRAWSDAA